MLAGEVDTIAVNIFDPGRSYVLFMFSYSDYYELCQAITQLSPHIFLGIIGFYMCRKGINRIRLVSNNDPGKYADLLIGLLYLGIGAWWFLPLRYIAILRYLKMQPYIQFDIPQAAFHFLNFVRLFVPTMALNLSKIPVETVVGILILGLTGLSGIFFFALNTVYSKFVANLSG